MKDHERRIRELTTGLPTVTSFFEEVTEMATLFGPEIASSETSNNTITDAQLSNFLYCVGKSGILSAIRCSPGAAQSEYVRYRRTKNRRELKAEQAHALIRDVVKRLQIVTPKIKAEKCYYSREIQDILIESEIFKISLKHFRQVVCKGLFGKPGRPRRPRRA